MENYKIDQLEPFGIVVRSNVVGSALGSLSLDTIRDIVTQSRVVVFRGFARLEGDDFPAFCSNFGEVLEFDFGVVNELSTRTDTKNYLYTNRDVPFHWDGAFIGRIPSLIFFHCDEAPEAGSGGETLFTDTSLMLEAASTEIRAKWESINITYTTEKIVHYGGSFSSPMIMSDPRTGKAVIRYAEPVTDLNPVTLDINGLPDGEREAFIIDMHERLNQPSVCYSHSWQDGDLLIADNHTLLHGRRAFNVESKRRIRRVNIL